MKLFCSDFSTYVFTLEGKLFQMYFSTLEITTIKLKRHYEKVKLL